MKDLERLQREYQIHLLMLFYLKHLVRLGQKWKRREQNLLKALLQKESDCFIFFLVGSVFAFLSQDRQWGGAKHLSTFFSAIGFSATQCQHIHGSPIIFHNPILRALQIMAISPRFWQLIASFSFHYCKFPSLCVCVCGGVSY